MTLSNEKTRHKENKYRVTSRGEKSIHTEYLIGFVQTAV